MDSSLLYTTGAAARFKRPSADEEEAAAAAAAGAAACRADTGLARAACLLPSKESSALSMAPLKKKEKN